MAQFKYRAKDMQGKIHKGTLEIASEVALNEELKSQGLFLIDAKDLTSSRGYKTFKTKQLAVFCRELSTLLASGISLVQALNIFSRQEGVSQDERVVYESILQDMRKGISLSKAMESKQCFPELLIGMLRSGEGNGNLDQVMDRLALQYEKENKLNQQVRSAMIYPAVLLVLCVIIVILIVTFILPQFQSLFDQMDDLPAITKFLISFSDFMVNDWYFLIMGVAIFVVIIRTVLGIPQVRRQVDYRKVHIALFGKLFKVIYSARFARTLSSLYTSGMPLANAISIAGSTIGNKYVEEQFDRVVFQVRSGIPLSQALKDVDGLILKLSSTILIGEESGRLDTMLNSIAETLEGEAEQATKQMVTLLEPILIVFMAILVGLIMIGVMLPIYQSYSAIENS